MKIINCLILCALSICLYAQNNLPIIKANSKNVAIKDDGYLDKDAWFLSPETKPDIYYASRSIKNKWVVFYTDVDSIKVKLEPGAQVDFIILLNNTDTCYTRIVSSSLVKNKLRQSKNLRDTIPFKLHNNEAIHVKGILNDKDTVNLHFDLGSLDFRLTRNTLNSTKGKIKKFQIGNLIWDDPTVQIANNVAREMDGRFGWRVFDGKIVEIDYDHEIIIVHSKLPRRRRGYVKSEIKFIQSLLCVEATIELNKKKYAANFLYDTGSDLAMVLDSAWMINQKFPNTQKIIRKSSFSDGAGRIYETSIVSIPCLRINNFVLTDIPTSKLGFKSPVGFEMNYFGNDLLKRFNCIIDLKKDNIYLKSNSLYYLPYNQKK